MRSTDRRNLLHFGLVAAAFSVALAGPISTASAVDPVNIRFASDLTGPPHPAAISKEYFKELIEQRIPGSSVKTYYAGALYNIPEAMEAMTEGNLEMVWGQFGKSAQVEPFMSVVVGPMNLSTPGAINSIGNFETVKMLKERLKKLHDIETLGYGHMSMFMGAGSNKRLLNPDDFSGKKIRSMGPVENAALTAWGANPTTMAFGDVPPALQTGVIDGLLTSLGGFNVTKDQAPFFTVAGINGIVGDYYWIGASGLWWKSLKDDQRKIISDTIVNDIMPFEKKINWCNDKRLLDQYSTTDPSKPGIYIASEAEQQVLADKLGNSTGDWIKANTPAEAHEWIAKFKAEAKAAVKANPIGSDPLEKTDCEAMKPWFSKYAKIDKAAEEKKGAEEKAKAKK
jgi:TRAP-type C4-dicarboxylate transport system substrate-binding protein